MDYDADVVYLSETWMKSNNDDITAMIKPYGYKIRHKRRRNRDNIIGVGVGVIKSVFVFQAHLRQTVFFIILHTTVKIQLNDKTNFTVITIYRLQFVTLSTFLEEFTVLLQILCSSGEMFVLSGYINIHLDTDEPNATRLKDIFTRFSLKQYDTFPIHSLGHTRDVVLTRSDSPITTGFQHNVKLSDHFLVEFTVGISAIKTEYMTVTYRDTKITSCHTLMSKVINTHASLKTNQIKVVPDAPWFDFEYKALRRRRRRAERRIQENRLSRTQECVCQAT